MFWIFVVSVFVGFGLPFVFVVIVKLMFHSDDISNLEGDEL